MHISNPPKLKICLTLSKREKLRDKKFKNEIIIQFIQFLQNIAKNEIPSINSQCVTINLTYMTKFNFQNLSVFPTSIGYSSLIHTNNP